MKKVVFFLSDQRTKETDKQEFTSCFDFLHALLEDNQKDGYIEIPECLRPYTGFPDFITF